MLKLELEEGLLLLGRRIAGLGEPSVNLSSFKQSENCSCSRFVIETNEELGEIFIVSWDIIIVEAEFLIKRLSVNIYHHI